MKYILCLPFILLVFNSSINACTCSTPTIEKGFMKSSLVIHGKVISKTYVSRRSLRTLEEIEESITRLKKKTVDSNSDSIAEIRINSYLKALDSKSITKVKIVVFDFFKNHYQLSDTLSIYTTGGAHCGYSRFEIGKEYIVYASKTKRLLNRNSLSTFWTGMCSRTKYKEKKELKKLRKLARINFDEKSLMIIGESIFSKNLIDLKKDTINIRLPWQNLNPDLIGEFKIQNKIVNSRPITSSKNSFDIILSDLRIDKNYNLEISFKSNDRSGNKYQGFVTLKYHSKRVKFENMNYLLVLE